MVDVAVRGEGCGLFAGLLDRQDGGLEEFCGSEPFAKRLFEVLRKTLEDGVFAAIEAEAKVGGQFG